MDLFASDVWGKLGVTFDATSLQTDGYKIVAEEERGSIDNEANVEYQNVSAKLDYNPTDRVNLFRPRGRLRRGTQQRQDRRGERHELEVRQRRRAAEVRRTAATSRRECSSTTRTSSRIRSRCRPRRRRAARAICRSRRQCRPTPFGSMVQWSRPFQFGSRSHVMSAGTDFRWIDGDSDELTFALATGTDAARPSRGRRHAAVRRCVRAGSD